MFSLTRSAALLAVLAVAIVQPVVGNGADCWAVYDCGIANGTTSATVLTRANGCNLPLAANFDDAAWLATQPAWVQMGDPPSFCGNRKSALADANAAYAEAIEFCWYIGATSACPWGACNADTCVMKPTGWGDPHFRTWAGADYDFHGECDLVFLDAPDANTTIHVRTTQRNDWSYISSAALRINGDVFELGSHGEWILNGVEDSDIPSTLGGYKFTWEKPDRKNTIFTVHMENGQEIILKSYKMMVAVKTQLAGQSDAFKHSKGLLGSPLTGTKVGRDGETWMYDDNAFGMEWQVRPEEDKIFETLREPQFPTQCKMPSEKAVASVQRRLGESMAREEAEKACANWGMNKEQCIYDVMVSGDMEMADAGAW